MAQPHLGHLIIDEENDELINRTIRVARLIATNTHAQPQIKLYDATIVYASTDWIVLAGTERVETTSGIRLYAQQWICTAVKPHTERKVGLG
jgi:hypothetical protein